jgi:hypothetical protein
MKPVTAFSLILIIFTANMAIGDEDDLSSAMMIAHFPPSYVYSVGADWPGMYHSEYHIDSYLEVNPTIPADTYDSPENPFVWYVLVGFCDGEDKAVAGAQFGFGDYDANAHYITSYGPGLAGTLEIWTENWPGPDSGTIIVTTGAPWIGNYEPFYYFEGYQYAGTTIVPISGYYLDDGYTWLNVELGNTTVPVISFEITDENRLGAMGVGTNGEGVECEDVSSTNQVSWGQLKMFHK